MQNDRNYPMVGSPSISKSHVTKSNQYLVFERTPAQKRAATKSCGSRDHAGRVHATFVRAAHRKFSETLQFFCASCAQNLCGADAGESSETDPAKVWDFDDNNS